MEYFTPAATSPSPKNDNLRKYLPTRYFLCLLNCGEDILNPRHGVPRFLYSTGVLLQELYLKLWVKLSLNSEINARQIFNVSCNNNSANRSWEVISQEHKQGQLPEAICHIKKGQLLHTATLHCCHLEHILNLTQRWIWSTFTSGFKSLQGPGGCWSTSILPRSHEWKLPADTYCSQWLNNNIHLVNYLWKTHSIVKLDVLLPMVFHLHLIKEWQINIRCYWSAHVEFALVHKV